jgi:hypothetical protein
VTCSCVTCAGGDESFQKGDNVVDDEHLNYHSIANPHPIVTFEAKIASDASLAPERFVVTARLKNPGGTDAVSTTVKEYSAAGLTAGASLRFAQQVDASNLPTGRYQWELTVVSHYSDRLPVTQTFTGFYEAVNNRREDVGNPYGDGWWLNGLDRVYPSADGALFVNDNVASSFFTKPASPPPGQPVTYILAPHHAAPRPVR